MALGSAPSKWTRAFKNLFKRFLSAAEERRIESAISEAQRATTAQIRVHVVGKVGEKNILDGAKRIFVQLGLAKASERHGVLILISHVDHRFAIFGDEGIHGKAGHPLWERAARTLEKDFAERRYADGIIACVREVGAELARHFPRAS